MEKLPNMVEKINGLWGDHIVLHCYNMFTVTINVLCIIVSQVLWYLLNRTMALVAIKSIILCRIDMTMLAWIS